MVWEYIERYRREDRWHPSDRKMAKSVGVSPTAFGNWRSLRAMPRAANLHALSELIGVPYLRLLDAALVDAGYLPKESEQRGRESAPTTPAGDDPASDDGADTGGGSPRPPASSDEVAPRVHGQTRPSVKRRTDIRPGERT